MNKEKKRYEVTIFGDQYVLISDESQEHVIEVATRVDTFMREIADASSMTDSKKVAVLAALKFADELAVLEAEVEQRKALLEALVDRIDLEISPASSP